MKPFEVILDVWLEGQTEPIAVQTDQRDYAAWEIRPEAENDRAWVFTRGRFCAWHAAKRAGQYAGDWKTFNEKDALQVKERAEEPEEDNPDLPKAS